MKPSFISIALAVIALVAASIAPVQADPLTGETNKFYQTPLNNGLVLMPPGGVLPPGSMPAPFPGHDEESSAYWEPSGGFYSGFYMADDFCDLKSTPIVHVMWWGSYMAGGGTGQQVQRFLISFESDVPVGPGNPYGFSHPGTVLSSQIVTNGALSPGSGSFTEVSVPIGPGQPNPDGNLFQYNAELAVPVAQQSNQVMWIKIVALLEDRQIKWGWHNRDYGVRDPLACTAPGVVPGEVNLHPTGQPVWHFQDDAVTGTAIVRPGPVPEVQQLSYTNTLYNINYDGVNTSKDLAFALYTKEQCTQTNYPNKWIQLPDLREGIGMNVYDVAPKILADDFLCNTNGPVTNIRVWGSWLNDNVGIITNFHLSFHADIPAGSVPYSRPGVELWSTNFVAGQYTQRPYTNSYEYFFDPSLNQIIGFDNTVFQYDFAVDPTKAFVQTNGVIYWLDVQAYTLEGQVFGWKSSAQHCYDDGVWRNSPTMQWQELRYPPGHQLAGQSFDLAFELTTSPCVPPVNPPTKWIELPDLDDGMNVLDVAPMILGDDFLCTLTGPITDIHIWGSWLNDMIGQLQNVQVSIYSDVPAGGTPPWSHPGNLLWTTNFLTGQFTWSFWTNSYEYFFDPNANQIVGSDTQIFRYNFCIDPANAFVQTNGTIYWLVVQAQQAMPSAATFGWKSAAKHCFDDAVWRNSDAMQWLELRYPPGHPLYGQSFDLAFEITTPIPWDTWRLAYFNSTNCALCGGLADYDGDTVNNTNEFLSGTNPTNSASAFLVAQVGRTGAGSNDVTLTWTTVGGYSYLVQTNAPAAGGHYTNNFSDLTLPFQIFGTGESTFSYTDGGGATNRPTRFYRVRLGPPVCQ